MVKRSGDVHGGHDQHQREQQFVHFLERFVQEYADAQAHHQVLVQDIKYLDEGDERRIRDKERRVVATFARAVAAVHPGLATARLEKPLTMLLFGMINWMFTWLRPDGPLRHDDMAPIVADLFLGGLGAVRLPR